VRFRRHLLLTLLLIASPLLGSSALEHARQARAMIGLEHWARVIRIENTSRRSVYPREVYALVFELGGVLWFYTDVNGTQSFSLHLNNLAEEKADFAPLLRDIEPGFAACTEVPDDEATSSARANGPLPNGCFIESYAALRERAKRGELILKARLLAFYVMRAGHPLGHTVLTYETPEGVFVIDSLGSGEPVVVARATADDPRALAHALRPDLKIARARWAPLATPLVESSRALLVGGGGAKHTRAQSAPEK
jgi:hypothetical protein